VTSPRRSSGDGRDALLQRAYLLFGERDVDALLDRMTEDVEWPDVAGGAVLHGPTAIRAYWEGQFAVSRPEVRLTDVLAAGDDLVAVVDQRVLDLDGNQLVPPGVVFHRYTFRGDLVRRMVVFTDREAALRPVPMDREAPAAKSRQSGP
jgi:hypothetical protein